MGNALCILLGLSAGAQGVWAIWTGEMSGRGRVARRSENPLLFDLSAGLLLFLSVVLLDIGIGTKILIKLFVGLLIKLVNLTL